MLYLIRCKYIEYFSFTQKLNTKEGGGEVFDYVDFLFKLSHHIIRRSQ
jgi:hypothetical protein